MNTRELLEHAMQLHFAAVADGDDKKVLEAQQIYLTLLNDHPDHAQIIFCLGTTFLQQGHNGLAINLFKQSAKYHPESPEVWNNLGSAYKAEQDDYHARMYYQKAFALREDPDYLNNLGTLYVNTGEPEEGAKLLDRALKMKPDHAKAAWNLSLLELERGNWKDGFRMYTAGLDSADRHIKPYVYKDKSGNEQALPFWDGEKGKKVIVYGEQGLGDEIMFSSCIEDLCKISKKVVVDCHPRLINIFRRSFSHLKNIEALVPERKKDTTNLKKVHKYDSVVPMGNLPQYFRSEGQFPREKYLFPDTSRAEKFVSKFVDHFGNDGPRVGIAWHGGSKRTHSDLRNMKLSDLLPVIKKGGNFVSLQYTDVADKVERFNEENGTNVYHSQSLVETFDYDETMSLIESLDLVICVCTSVAHLCGAMGKECWVLTPYERAWRYARFPAEKMYQYGDWVTMMNKDKDEPWADLIQRVAAKYERWCYAQ